MLEQDGGQALLEGLQAFFPAWDYNRIIMLSSNVLYSTVRYTVF